MAEDAQSKTSGSGFIPATAPEKPNPAPPPTSSATVPATVGKAEPIPHSPSSHSDQLARIEDKTARIEDKYARSEALLSRVEEKVEGAATRMNDAARQSDLAALRGEVRGINERVRKVPGTGALIVTAVITSVLTVALLLLAQGLHLEKYVPQRPAPTTQQ